MLRLRLHVVLSVLVMVVHLLHLLLVASALVLAEALVHIGNQVAAAPTASPIAAPAPIKLRHTQRGKC